MRDGGRVSAAIEVLAEIEARHALLIDVMSLAQDHRLRLGSGMEMAMNTEEGS